MVHLPEGFRPDLIAIDLDDTLVPHLGGISERVVESIARVRDAGIMVVPSTGRTVSTTAPIARAADLDGWMVCSNGAILATVEPETIIDSITFDPAPLLVKLQQLVPDAVYAVEDINGVFHTTHMFNAGALGLSIREVPFDHLLADPVVRLVVRSEKHARQGFDEVAREMGFHSVIFGVADVAWMDVGPKGTNKATRLADLCKRLDINAAQTLAIGDSFNDIEMLKWAGVGVAMGSAPRTVKEVADTETSGVPGDGVADVLDAIRLD
jgi:Cof subfamily protein (haloacid dehalogenase superfamily)